MRDACLTYGTNGLLLARVAQQEPALVRSAPGRNGTPARKLSTNFIFSWRYRLRIQRTFGLRLLPTTAVISLLDTVDNGATPK